MVKWIIQNNLGHMDDTEKMKACFQALKIPYETIKVIPFSDEPPDVDTSGLSIFYGSTTLTKNVYNSGKWKPGVWFNPESYKFENILNGYGKENLLNGDSRVLSIDQFISENHQNNELFFVRPAADMKEFTGSVMEFSEIKEWKNRLESTNGPLTLETKIQVAEPKNIAREYRTIVVDKQVVAYSQYKRDGRLNMRDDVHAPIVLYASAMARLHQPAPVFVLDVCELQNDDKRIVEVNTFNCAGFYWGDFFNIIKEVTEFTKRTYG